MVVFLPGVKKQIFVNVSLYSINLVTISYVIVVMIVIIKSSVTFRNNIKYGTATTIGKTIKMELSGSLYNQLIK